MITSQKRDQIISWITESEIRPEAKERALSILRRPELAEEDTETILDIIQTDIEADFSQMSGFAEYLEKQEEHTAFIARQKEEDAELEKVINTAVEFVEIQSAELNALESEIKTAEDESQLGDVKSRLGME